MPSLQRLRVLKTRVDIFIVGQQVFRVVSVDETETGTETGGTDFRILRIVRQQGAPEASEGPQLSLSAMVNPMQRGPDDTCSCSFTEEEVSAWENDLKSKHKELEVMCEGAHGVIGFIKLLDSFYMQLVTERREVGQLVGHTVFEIVRTRLIQLAKLPHQAARLALSNVTPGEDEATYVDRIQSVDLTKGFFFSYTYDLSHTVQQNLGDGGDGGGGGGHQSSQSVDTLVDTQWIWNTFLMEPLLEACAEEGGRLRACDWSFPVIHGAFMQRLVHMPSPIRITLLARRSRHFAGTRYARRGVNAHGFVANEVETEQVIEREPTLLHVNRVASSMLQARGSIPLYWSHTNLMAPRPGIAVHGMQPVYDEGVSSQTMSADGNAAAELAGDATRQHFDRLFERHGFRAVTCLSLIKQDERKPHESKLGAAFEAAVSRLDRRLALEAESKAEELEEKEKEEEEEGEDGTRRRQVLYMTYDFLNASKDGENVFDVLYRMGETIFPRVGFFFQGLSRGERRDAGVESAPRRQHGVMRTNCVDCLDRTNVAQFCFSCVVLTHQLIALGIVSPAQSRDSVAVAECFKVFMEMFAEHGDRMARQYGGSGAMHKVDERGGNNVSSTAEIMKDGFVITGGARNALTAVKRYYSNNITDHEKQQAMDLFLGIFRVERTGRVNIWTRFTQAFDKSDGRGSSASGNESPSSSFAASFRRFTLDSGSKVDGDELEDELKHRDEIEMDAEGERQRRDNVQLRWRVLAHTQGGGGGGFAFQASHFDTASMTSFDSKFKEPFNVPTTISAQPNGGDDLIFLGERWIQSFMAGKKGDDSAGDDGGNKLVLPSEERPAAAPDGNDDDAPRTIPISDVEAEADRLRSAMAAGEERRRLEYSRYLAGDLLTSGGTTKTSGHDPPPAGGTAKMEAASNNHRESTFSSSHGTDEWGGDASAPPPPPPNESVAATMMEGRLSSEETSKFQKLRHFFGGRNHGSSPPRGEPSSPPPPVTQSIASMLTPDWPRPSPRNGSTYVSLTCDARGAGQDDDMAAMQALVEEFADQRQALLDIVIAQQTRLERAISALEEATESAVR